MPTQEERSAKTRAELLAAAKELFGESDKPNDVTVDRIAARAGVSKGGFYHHFACRDEMIKAVLEEISQRKPDLPNLVKVVRGDQDLWLTLILSREI